eukprot:COSAG01_NODE_7_length_54400_cov_1218.054935_27_plen_344_part_00
MTNKKNILISLDIGNKNCRCAIYEIQQDNAQNKATLLKLGAAPSKGLDAKGNLNETLLQTCIQDCIQSTKVPIDKQTCQIISTLPLTQYPQEKQQAQAIFQNQDKLKSNESKKENKMLKNANLPRLKNCVESACEIFTNQKITYLYEGFTLSDYGLSAEEREKGILLIDIGSNSSKIQVIQNNKIQALHSIPIGGNTLTKDLSVCLQTSEESAEKLKILTGNLCENSSKGEFKFENKSYDKSLIQKIIAARTTEWIQLIQACSPLLPIVLSGGGSLVKNKQNFLKKKYIPSVRLLHEKKLNPDCPRLPFATSIANMHYATQNKLVSFPEKQENKVKKWFQNWL